MRALPLPTVLLTALVFGLALPARSESSIEVNVEAFTSAVPGTNIDSFNESDPTSALYRSLAVATGKGSNAAARAAAGNGYARAASYSVAINNNGDHDRATGVGTASFWDVFVIDAPGLTGTPGTATMGFQMDGFTSVVMEGDPFVCCGTEPGMRSVAHMDILYYIISYDDPAFTNEVDSLNDAQNLVADYPDAPGEYFDAELGTTLNFVYGAPIQFRFDLIASSGAYGWYYVDSHVATAISDFFATATWAGITDVRDAGGNPVAEISLTSFSGTDYRNAIVPDPVPEPDPTWALLFGLGLTGLAAHRRARRISAVGTPDRRGLGSAAIDPNIQS